MRPRDYSANDVARMAYLHEVVDRVPGDDTQYLRSVTDDAHVLVGLGDVLDLSEVPRAALHRSQQQVAAAIGREHRVRLRLQPHSVRRHLHVALRKAFRRRVRYGIRHVTLRYVTLRFVSFRFVSLP